jgi:hypothetical protein
MKESYEVPWSEEIAVQIENNVMSPEGEVPDLPGEEE